MIRTHEKLMQIVLSRPAVKREYDALENECASLVVGKKLFHKRSSLSPYDRHPPEDFSGG